MTEAEKRFLKLKFCPVCKQELRNYKMGDRKALCVNHGTFTIVNDTIVWEW